MTGDGEEIVTLRDVYTSVQDVASRLAKLETAPEQIRDHEARLRVLEAWKYGLPATLITALAALAAALFGG